MSDNIDVPCREAATLMGTTYTALIKRCQRGKVPGAYKRFVDGQDQWFIPQDAVYPGQSSNDAEYEALFKEWTESLRIGLNHKRPFSEKSITAYKYGMDKFWIFVEAPPQEIKKSFKKGEKRPRPSVVPNIKMMTRDNLALAIANVPIDHKNEECHFSMKEKLYVSFRSFFKFLSRKGLRSHQEYSELSTVEFERVYEEKRVFLEESDILKLLKTNRTMLSGRYIGLQEFHIALTEVIIMLAATAGARRGDIASLTMESIDFGRGEFRVLGKGNKWRTIGMCPELIASIQKWLTYRPKKTATTHLLVNSEGNPLEGNYIYRRVKRISKQSGIEVWTHGLRASYASISVAQGASVAEVSNTLGHTRISTTEKSYVRSSEKKAIAAAQRFSLTQEAPQPPRIIEDKGARYWETLRALQQLR